MIVEARMRWRRDGGGDGGVVGDEGKEVMVGGERDGGRADWRESISGGERSWGSA